MKIIGKETPIVFQTKFGEMIICTTEDSDPTDDTNIAFLEAQYPALLIPQQNGQLGFQLAFPFSDHDKPMSIRKDSIDKMSIANDQISNAYDSWKTQVKAQMSGIVTASQVVSSNDLNQG